LPVGEQARLSVGRRSGVCLDEKKVQDGARGQDGRVRAAGRGVRLRAAATALRVYS